MRTRRIALSLAALFAAATASASWFDCDQTAPRSASIALAGATRVVVVGRAGSLKVTGRAGATDVRATGTACSTSAADLRQIALRATRSGSEVRLEAEVPDNLLGQNRLDFEVALPSNVAVKVIDGSGQLTIENTAALEVDDGSGGLTIRHVGGDLRVHDGSGSMIIEDVAGNAHIEDGSGSLEVHRVTGSVILDDGSGSVDVTDVGGDLRVEHKGSGHVHSDRIKGKVTLPRR